jgi:hypothetical protein
MNSVGPLTLNFYRLSADQTMTVFSYERPQGEMERIFPCWIVPNWEADGLPYLSLSSLTAMPLEGSHSRSQCNMLLAEMGR